MYMWPCCYLNLSSARTGTRDSTVLKKNNWKLISAVAWLAASGAMECHKDLESGAMNETLGQFFQELAAWLVLSVYVSFELKVLFSGVFKVSPEGAAGTSPLPAFTASTCTQLRMRARCMDFHPSQETLLASLSLYRGQVQDNRKGLVPAPRRGYL